MRKLTSAIILATLLAITTPLRGQKAGIKMNLLYGIVTKTPNLGIELSLNEKNTIDLWSGYNPWNHDGKKNDNKKIVHWIVQPEWKYWFCSSFNGHFIGIHGLGAFYNINKTEVPHLFDKNYRYEGYLAGGGISYGYHWILGKRWNLEASLGIGAAHMKYDIFQCQNCGFKKEKNKQKTYYGPTKASVSIIYIIK